MKASKLLTMVALSVGLTYTNVMAQDWIAFEDSVATPQTPPYEEPWPPSAPAAEESLIGVGQWQDPMMQQGDPFLAPTDPWVAQQGAGGVYSYGPNGPQPYRFGWTSRYDFTYLSDESVTTPPGGPSGDFGVFEFNAEWEHTKPLATGWIFSTAPQFNLRLWNGPVSSTLGLPGSVYRFGYDIEMATPANGPWSVQFGFTPSLNTSFEQSPSSNAWQFDGRGVLFYHPSPQWTFAIGAGFRDRVRDLILPFAGVVWQPNDRWEWRLLFPQPRVTYFLGAPCGVATWLYVAGEWRAESYEIELESMGVKDQIEIEDWRLVGGIRTDSGFVSSFLEAGWVFEREVRFRSLPGGEISDGFVGRFGLRF